MAKMQWSDQNTSAGTSGSIPGIMSIRAPPAPVSVNTQRETMLGITKSEVSERYIVKLQKDRERNNKAMYNCLDNLPIQIR